MNRTLRSLIIILFPLAFILKVNGQTGNLSGYVKDNKGQPVTGANIIIDGTNYGAVSNDIGAFAIEHIPYGKYTLTISFIGFKKEKVSVIFDKNYLPVNVILQPGSVETEQVIVSAGKYEQKLSDVTVSTAILDPQVLSQKNILQLDEALRYVPGVNVELNQVSIRGSSGYSKGAGTRVLIAVDGVPIYTGDTGEIVWQLIPLSDIERVEVIKGPASSLYGQTAIGGVINIITRKTPAKPITYVKTFAGFYGNPSYPEWKWTNSLRTFYGLEVAHSDRIGKLGYTVSLRKYDNDSYRQNDYSKNYSGYLKLDYDFDENNAIKFTGYYLNSDQGNFLYWKDSRNALIPDTSNLGLYIKSTNLFASLIFHHNFSDNFSGIIKSSFYRSVENGYSDHLTTIAGNLFRNEFIGTLKLKKDWVIVSGAEVAYAYVTSSVFANPYFLTASLYVQSEYKITEKINSVIGIRDDYIKLETVTNTNAITPRAGLNYKISDNLILRSSFATGFRAPTPAEAFLAATSTGGLTVVNNPNLDYETSVSYEVGALYKPVSTLSFDAALFNTDYKNFIEPVLTTSGNIQFVNLPRARIQGIELVTNYDPGFGLPVFSIGYDYLWARDLDKNQFLKYRPRHTIYGSIEFSPYPFEFRTDVRYWSKYEEIDVDITEPPFNLIPDGQDRSDAFVVDLSAGYNFSISSKPIKVALTGKNIFNYNYIEFIGNLAPIRNFALSMEAYF
jgi:outer membrane receptor for ferrienterochelin and colicins